MNWDNLDFFVGCFIGLLLGGFIVYFNSKRTRVNFPNNHQTSEGERAIFIRNNEIEIRRDGFKFSGSDFALVAILITAIIFWYIFYSSDKQNSATNKHTDTVIAVDKNNNTTKVVSPTPSVSSNKPNPQEAILKQLKSNMFYGIENPSYTIQKHPADEVVQGKKGCYYIVDLKDSEGNNPVLFNIKEYELNEMSARFRESVTEFRKNILEQFIRGNKSYDLFIHGSADRGRHTALGRLNEEKQISYLPKIANNQFSLNVNSMIVTEYTNNELPNLRASYLQNKLQSLGIKSTILEGSVTSEINNTERNATVYLFVNWNAPCSDN